MKIQKFENISFGQKPSISLGREKLQTLRTILDRNAEQGVRGLKLLDSKKCVELYGQKRPFVNETFPEYMGFSFFKVGKTELVIDNNTGEFFYYEKRTAWSNVIKNLDKYLNFFKENYDNSEKIFKVKKKLNSRL